jgi:riboflavin biosynthesis pyrimidine reductase
LSVLLEAGPALNGTALAACIVNRLVLFYAPKLAGETILPFAKAPSYPFPPLRVRALQQFGPDVAIEALLL